MKALGLISLVVRDYDEAIRFFVEVLGFGLVEDTYIPAQDKRWVVVAPPGGLGASLLLAKASSARQEAFIGDQCGGRVFLFLYTQDFPADYQRLIDHGIRFEREPELQPHGMVAVFKDPYGNLWDLIEPSEANRSFSFPVSV